MVEIVTAPASPTTDKSGPDEALGPRDGSCNRNTRDIEAPSPLSVDLQDMEQLEYQYRPRQGIHIL